MSTPPASPPPPPTQGFDRPYYGANMPPLPTPTSELVLYLLMLFVIGLIVLFDDNVGPDTWITAASALTIGYLLSRGLAKLGKVYENR